LTEHIKCININTNTLIENNIPLTSGQYSINYATMECDNLYLNAKDLDISEINSNFINSNLRKNKLNNILKKIKNNG